MAVGDAAAGRCAVHLRTPAMAAAPREGVMKMAVRERASWRIKVKVLQEATRELAHRRTCWRTRAVRDGTVAVGDAAAGRVHRAFEDAGDGRWPRRREKGRRKWRCQRVRSGGCKVKVPQEATREPAARREAEAVRQDATQQPAGANEDARAEDGRERRLCDERQCKGEAAHQEATR